MNRFERDLPVVYLKPGEMHFAKEPSLVVTVLGSCLSVTMYCKKKKLGGICHGLLPQCGSQRACEGRCLEGFKYVSCSIERMVRLFDKHGVKRRDIEVKCFGGADMFKREIRIPGLVSIGRQNVQVAEQILAKEGLSLKVSDVGGLQGRKILFYTDTGDVYLKRLTRENNPDSLL